MSENMNTYCMPNVGCLIGTVYQLLLGQLVAALDRAELDITPPEYLVLRTLYSRDGLQQCEIASVVGKDKGAISRCVAAMVKKKLVITESVSHKCMRVYLSPKACEIKPSVMQVADDCHNSLASLLTIDEMTQFSNILGKIVNNLICKK